MHNRMAGVPLLKDLKCEVQEWHVKANNALKPTPLPATTLLKLATGTQEELNAYQATVILGSR